MSIDLPGAGLGNVVLDAPNDGITYGRKNLVWSPIDVLEAPTDGIQYVRRDASWQQLDLIWAIFDNVVTVNDITDLPAPVGNVITLLPNKTYILADNINLGINALELSSNTSIKGLESINTTLTYTGTGDMFIMYNVIARISNLTINCPNGSAFNWTSTGGLILRLHDLEITTARLGTFTGIDSIVRMTNFAPIVTQNGAMFYGTFNTLLINSCAGQVYAGNLFDLGSAVFDGITIDKIISYVAPGTSIVKGLTGSANIRNNGAGVLMSARNYGGGNLLSGIANGDALWRFFNNYQTPDTRADGLIALSNNATVTTPLTTTTPVKVAGTWQHIRSSQMSTTTDGRLTYLGGNGAIVPISVSLSISPGAGNTQIIAAYIAINGVLQLPSKGTIRTDVGDTNRLSLIWQAELMTNDYVEVFIVNETSVTTINVPSAVIRVN